MSTHIVIGDPHAHYQHNNDRAEWAGELIADIQPDVVVCIGDSADMPSLAGYDKGKKAAIGRTYRADIDAHLEFQERLWAPVRKRKKKMPRRVFTEGNHEERINRAIEFQPELEGAIGYADLRLSDYYDDIAYYDGNTPGCVSVDGVTYAHYFVSGIMGRPVGGEHPGYALIKTQLTSCTAGHNHLLDGCTRTTRDGRRIYGLTVGWFGDYRPGWAGKMADLWWSGLCIKRNVQNGEYDLQTVSTEALRREYGNG